MTIKQLISALKKFDPSMEVVISGRFLSEDYDDYGNDYVTKDHDGSIHTDFILRQKRADGRTVVVL